MGLKFQWMVCCFLLFLGMGLLNTDKLSRKDKGKVVLVLN